jgi:hypothetical protein
MRRRSKFLDVSTIDVQGVLGTFKVPNADLTVEYILTYASLDGGDTTNGQLLDLLVPVREVFDLEDMDFDHLLQRDLDDFRVSEEMVPYLLGETSSDPRFFPPIVAVIVPITGKKMNKLYPECTEDEDEDQGVPLKVFNYGNIFSVKREVKREQGKDEQLAQSLVDLCIHPTRAKLVIVDGQHRAMAMLASYRSASNKWSENEFQYFYKEIDLDISTLHQIQLPVCIAYFPELTSDVQEEVDGDLRTACRKLFLDVNRNARQPSKAREILLDDTDLVACFTRQLFNMVKENTDTRMLQLHHTEYDNPHDKIPTTRPFALTNVYTISDVIKFVLLSSNNSILKSTARYYSGRSSENNHRLRRELALDDVLTEEDKSSLGIGISNIEQYNYPKRGEDKFRQCFKEGWGQVIMNSLSKFYPFSKHIEAVDIVLKEGDPYMGENKIAYTALVKGQGLRHTLGEKQKSHKSSTNQNEEKSKVQKAWEVLQAMEENFKKYRAQLYLELNSAPNDEQIKMVNSIYDCFCSNAFQTGLFMAFAYMKAKIGIENQQEFIQIVDKWISYMNNRFQNFEGIRRTLFNHSDSKSLRSIFKPEGGLIPSDGHFCRYLILELLCGHKDEEAASIEEAQREWRQKLYTIRYDYRAKKDPLPIDDNDTVNIQRDLDEKNFKEIVDSFKYSLDIDEEDIKRDLKNIRQKISQYVPEVEDEDETDD